MRSVPADRVSIRKSTMAADADAVGRVSATLPPCRSSNTADRNDRSGGVVATIMCRAPPALSGRHANGGFSGSSAMTGLGLPGFASCESQTNTVAPRANLQTSSCVDRA